MQRSTRFKILLGLCAAFALAVIVVFRTTDHGPRRGGENADDTPPPAAVAPVAAAPIPPPSPAAPPPSPAAPPPVPHPPGPDQSPSTHAAPPPPESEAAKPLNEAVLMARLRKVAGSDFPLAVELARAGNRRFPDSPDAPERASIMIHALAAEGKSSEARGEAEYAVNHYPDSDWVRDIEAFTGAHRHRNLYLTDGGVIQAR
ncbi:MAG TPA: hypothetical protein VN853_20420 [Polyangia bacterium]|nr:hypothetical protein [Polyangia bacterium]